MLLWKISTIIIVVLTVGQAGVRDLLDQQTATPQPSSVQHQQQQHNNSSNNNNNNNSSNNNKNNNNNNRTNNNKKTIITKRVTIIRIYDTYEYYFTTFKQNQQ